MSTSALSLVVSPDQPSSRRRSSGSDLEDAFYLQVTLANLPLPQRQYRFARPRRFAFDFFWELDHHTSQKGIALEIEGGVWTGGRHTRGSGFVKDIEKYNLACMGGILVYRATAQMVKDGTALALIEQALATHSLPLSSSSSSEKVAKISPLP